MGAVCIGVMAAESAASRFIQRISILGSPKPFIYESVVLFANPSYALISSKPILPTDVCNLAEMLVARHLSWFVAFVSLICLSCQQTKSDPNESFCRRWGHQTCVIGNKLYIDGGYIASGGNLIKNGGEMSTYMTIAMTREQWS